MTWAASACRTPSGTNPARSATPRPNGSGFIPTSPSACWHARPADVAGCGIEVLQRLARGLYNREVAERLVIGRKTAAPHVEHMYAERGTTTRALASLFAATHGLSPDAATAAAADVTPGDV